MDFLSFFGVRNSNLLSVEKYLKHYFVYNNRKLKCFMKRPGSLHFICNLESVAAPHSLPSASIGTTHYLLHPYIIQKNKKKGRISAV